MTTYNNSHCQAHLLADLLTIPLMYNLVLWNNFLKKKKKKNRGHDLKGQNKDSLGFSGFSNFDSVRFAFRGVPVVVCTRITQNLDKLKQMLLKINLKLQSETHAKIQ